MLPDAEAKAAALDLLAFMRAGEYVYLQCGTGDGRTGTMGAILLGLAYGLSSSEALDLAQRSRNDRLGASGSVVETHEQRMQVHRLLGDTRFRAAAAAVTPRASDSAARDVAAAVAAALLKVRSLLARRGPTALLYLRRFAEATIGGGPLSRAGFDSLARDAEWFLTPSEADALWRGAAGGTGGVTQPTVAALFELLQGPLSQRRAAVVADAFRRLGGGAGGAVGLDRLTAAFRPDGHPDVMSGRRSRDAVRAEFVDTFGVEERGARGGATVTFADFSEYYAAIAAAVPDDALFEQLVGGVWPAGLADQARARGADKIAAPIGTRSEADVRRGGHGASGGAPSVLEPLIAAAAARAGGRLQQRQAYVDPTDPLLLLPALRSHLVSAAAAATAVAAPLRGGISASSASNAPPAAGVGVGDLGIALLGAALRAADTDRDGRIASFDMRAALVGASAPLPDADIDLVMRGLARGLGLSGGGGGGGTPRQLPPPAQLPLEAAYALIRGGQLPPRRRATVVSRFAELDLSRDGAIPLASLLSRFDASAHPVVAGARASPEPLQAQFLAAFGDGFRLVDAAGPAARASGDADAEAAYDGAGDGRVRLPWFEAFHEAVSAAVGPDDAAFDLAVFSMWGGAGAPGRRTGGGAYAAASPAASLLSPAAPASGGLVASMARLNREARPAARGAGLASINAVEWDSTVRRRREEPVAPVAPAQGAAASPGRSGYRLPQSDNHPIGSPGSAGAGVGVLDGGSTGGYGSASFIRARAGQGPSGGSNSTGNAVLDAALSTARTTLLTRGPKALFSLIRSLEHSTGGDLFATAPSRAVAAALRDASLGLSSAEVATICAAFGDPDSASDVYVYAIVDGLRGGPLSQSRAQLVEAAFAALLSRSSAVDGAVSLDTVRMAYRSAAHPDVRASRRREADVLREFLESFDGPTFVHRRSADGSAVVDANGWTEYHACLSAFVPSDGEWGVLVYDVWGLSDGAAGGGASTSAAAAGGVRVPRHRADPGLRAMDDAYAARGSLLNVSAGGYAGSNVVGCGSVIRGHGLERLGYGPGGDAADRASTAAVAAGGQAAHGQRGQRSSALW